MPSFRAILCRLPPPRPGRDGQPVKVELAARARRAIELPGSGRRAAFFAGADPRDTRLPGQRRAQARGIWRRVRAGSDRRARPRRSKTQARHRRQQSELRNRHPRRRRCLPPPPLAKRLPRCRTACARLNPCRSLATARDVGRDTAEKARAPGHAQGFRVTVIRSTASIS